MSTITRIRPSQHVALPTDMADPLLWRLAFDVASTHQADEDGRCRNPLCQDQTGPCVASITARRAMWLAQGPALVRRQLSRPAHERRRLAAVPALPAAPTGGGGSFAGWFTTSTPIVTQRRELAAPPLPQRRPGAALEAA